MCPVRVEPIAHALKRPRLQLPTRNMYFKEHPLRTLLSDLHNAIHYRCNEYFIGAVLFARGPRNTLTVAEGRKRLATISILQQRIRSRLDGAEHVRGQQRGPRTRHIIDEFLDDIVGQMRKQSRERILRRWLDFIEERISVVTATVPRTAAPRRGRKTGLRLA